MKYVFRQRMGNVGTGTAASLYIPFSPELLESQHDSVASNLETCRKHATGRKAGAGGKTASEYPISEAVIELLIERAGGREIECYQKIRRGCGRVG